LSGIVFCGKILGRVRRTGPIRICKRCRMKLPTAEVTGRDAGEVRLWKAR